MLTLVDRLCAAWSPVTAVLRPEPNRENLRQCVERGYVHVKFTETAGGTELGVRLDDESKRTALRELEDNGQTISLRGYLKLDGVPVYCAAKIDVNAFTGFGQLERVEGAESDTANKR